MVVHDLQFERNVAKESVWHVSCTEDITLKVASGQDLILYCYYVLMKVGVYLWKQI